MFGASVRKLCIWVIIMISMSIMLAQQEEQGDHNTTRALKC